MNALRRLGDALEVWLYELNERNHWLFRLLEWGNEIHSRIVFRGVRRRAALIHGVAHALERLAQVGARPVRLREAAGARRARWETT